MKVKYNKNIHTVSDLSKSKTLGAQSFDQSSYYTGHERPQSQLWGSLSQTPDVSDFASNTMKLKKEKIGGKDK